MLGKQINEKRIPSEYLKEINASSDFQEIKPIDNNGKHDAIQPEEMQHEWTLHLL
jgi:hypothetical protein